MKKDEIEVLDVPKVKKKNKILSKLTKSDIVKLSIIAVVFFISILGLSYAVFTFVINGAKEFSVTSGIFSISFEDSDNINLTNAGPISDEEGLATNPYSFSVENTGNVDGAYQIYLEEAAITKDTLNKEYVKYSIKQDDGAWSEPALLSSLGSGVVLVNINLLAQKQKINYQLKLWLDINADNNAQNKIFQGKVVVQAVQTNGDLSDFTAPLIKLNGEKSINVEQNGTFTDPGVASIEDNKDGVIATNKVTTTYEYFDGTSTVTVTNIDTTKTGTYYIYYKVKDNTLNEGVVVRSVNVYKPDTTVPTITLVGDSKVTVKQGETYTEPGVTALNNEIDISDKIVTIGTVNTNNSGVHIIKYMVINDAGNIASITREVEVLDSSLTSVLRANAVMDNVKSDFVSSTTGIDFGSTPSDTNGKGVYIRAGTENDQNPIYYYRGIIDNNNVIFNNMCWKIVRTTELGGTRLIYNGVPTGDGSCNNTGTASQIGTSKFNSNSNSPADVGYMYGTRYTYLSKFMGASSWYRLAGKSLSYRGSVAATSYYYGDDVTWDGTNYTLTNSSQLLYSGNYSTLKGKYTCLSETGSTCTSVNYIDSAYSSSMNTVLMSGGETYSSIYSGLQSAKWVYGNDVAWDGTNYTLTNTVSYNPVDEYASNYSTAMNAHRYSCLSTNGTCSTVYYIHYFDSSSIYYMTLKDGKNIDNALDEMFSENNDLRNATDSVIKTYIDNWYSTNMNSVTKKLEDSIYCNDRSIYQKNGWDKDSKTSGFLYFGASGRVYFSPYKPSATCPNKNDAFTVENTSGNSKLVYPVMLLTADEATMAGSGRIGYSASAYLNIGQYWFFASSSNCGIYGTGVLSLSSSGATAASSGSAGVRPSVSLKSGAKIISGDGSVTSPYVIE